MDKKNLNNEKDMLQGNIARLILSNDVDELENMRYWAHRRIDMITDAKLQQISAEVNNEPKLINTWAELKECESATHTLEIDVEGCNGWIKSKNSNENDKDYFKHNHYLSTHTFYGSTHAYSTELLQKCGFNVRLANWDE